MWQIEIRPWSCRPASHPFSKRFQFEKQENLGQSKGRVNTQRKRKFKNSPPGRSISPVLALTLIFAAIYFLYEKYHKSTPPSLPVTTPETPIKEPDVATPIQPAKEQARPPDEQSSNMKPPTIHKKKDTLCLKIESNIFIVPRQIAIDLTRKKLNVIYLPEEYTGCLKSGPITFRISDFDRKSLFPFRHYMDLRSNIVSIESLNTENTPKTFIEEKLTQFDQIFSLLNGKRVSKITVGSLLVENKNFQLDSTVPLFSEILTTKPAQSVSLAELLKSYPLLKNKFVPPSHPSFVEIMKNWDPNINTFVVDSKYEFWQANFEAAYLLHFNKPTYVYFNPFPAEPQRTQRRWIYRNNLLPDLQTALFVDLRPLKSAKHFNFKNQLKINVSLRGAGHYQDILDRMESNSFFTQSAIQFYTENISKNINNLKSKKIILIGLSDYDILVETFYKLLPPDIQKQTYTYRYGFYDLILSSYFYKTNYFLPEENFDIYKESDIVNYLHLSF